MKQKTALLTRSGDVKKNNNNKNKNKLKHNQQQQNNK